MRLSLRDYLRCGHLEGIRQGTTKAQIEALLGTPEAVSVESRKNKKPAIWKYGSLEILFQHPERECAGSITFNPCGWPNESFVFPQEWTVEDWDLFPNQPKQAVFGYLKQHNLLVDNAKTPRSLPHITRLAGSGVALNFQEDDTLWSIGGPLTE